MNFGRHDFQIRTVSKDEVFSQEKTVTFHLYCILYDAFKIIKRSHPLMLSVYNVLKVIF